MSVMNVFLQEHKQRMENFHEQVLVRRSFVVFFRSMSASLLPQKREPAGIRAGMRAEIPPLELQKAVLVR